MDPSGFSALDETVIDPFSTRHWSAAPSHPLSVVPSNNEGRRKIVQGGVRLDGEEVTDADLEVDAADVDGKLLQLGRRNWARLRA